MTKCGPLSGFLVFGVLLSAGWHEASPPVAAIEPAKATVIGAKVPTSHSLRDLRGNRRSLHGFTGHRALVLAFVGTECPVSNLYLPGLIELEKKYRSQQVQFLAVYPNEHEDLEQVSAHAY